MPQKRSTRDLKNVRIAAIILCLLVAIPVAVIALYRYVAPPLTPLMVMRTAGYGAEPKMPPPSGWRYQWVPLQAIAPTLSRAVIASEDQTFCTHYGFDREAFNEAFEKLSAGEPTRGGSTVTQQSAKNVFLWPGRSAIRKVLEAGLTPMLELLWGKRRIMEVYLNVVEWAPGVYGAQAAAQFHFHKDASALTPREAALLATVLPNPREWSASKPGPYVSERSGVIAGRANAVDASCVRGS